MLLPPDLVVLVGHSEASKGSTWADGTKEWDWCRALAPLVLDAAGSLGLSAEVRWRGREQGGAAGLAAEVRHINALRPRCVVELHTDAVQAPTISSSPMLYYPGSTRSYALASHLADTIGTAYHQRRRVIAQDKSWNGPGPHVGPDGKPAPQGAPLVILRDTVCPAVIAEMHFGTHLSSCDYAHRHQPTVARAVAEGVLRWLREVKR